MVQKGSNAFEILSGKEVLVTGRAKFDTKIGSDVKIPSKSNASEDSVYLTEEDVYREFEHRGHKYGGKYKSIKSVTIDQGGKLSNNLVHRILMTYLDKFLRLLILSSRKSSRYLRMLKL